LILAHDLHYGNTVELTATIEEISRLLEAYMGALRVNTTSPAARSPGGQPLAPADLTTPQLD